MPARNVASSTSTPSSPRTRRGRPAPPVPARPPSPGERPSTARDMSPMSTSVNRSPGRWCRWARRTRGWASRDQAVLGRVRRAQRERGIADPPPAARQVVAVADGVGALGCLAHLVVRVDDQRSADRRGWGSIGTRPSSPCPGRGRWPAATGWRPAGHLLAGEGLDLGGQLGTYPCPHRPSPQCTDRSVPRALLSNGGPDDHFTQRSQRGKHRAIPRCDSAAAPTRQPSPTSKEHRGLPS